MTDTSSLAIKQRSPFCSSPAARKWKNCIPFAEDGCVFIKVRAADTESLENFLMEIQSFEGVRSVRSDISLSTFLARGPSPD
ncbi:Lrp/AsnC ligand binding domain-containing protein [Serratia marcescens]|uniref:Lrp/AsnC ligand binding domain-containing protein n=1 Tax=Serratia TaxID=613 RepID=UPI001CE44D86|nr:Lrp/AsnC ligand binding domain-containing protein [Serratia marcescens]